MYVANSVRDIFVVWVDLQRVLWELEGPAGSFP
jgi:hypothetical protein